jgi:hypothetical protein
MCSSQPWSGERVAKDYATTLMFEFADMRIFDGAAKTAAALPRQI